MSRLKTMIIPMLATSMALPAIGSGQVVIPVMVGRWEGDAQMVVNWTRQRTLGVSIEIFANDSVAGTVGDAKLVNGRFLKSPGSLPGVLRWKTDYIIEAGFSGPIIRAENIHRASVRIPLNWIGDGFRGGISTSGWMVRSVEYRVVAANVTLHRALVANEK
jgi:hypothetical protein